MFFSKKMPSFLMKFPQLHQMFIPVQMLATGKAYDKENGTRFLSMEGINASTCLVICFNKIFFISKTTFKL
jgi:hypothetical protein